MALIDVASREIHGKIVYYGPALGSKTTNLRDIRGQIPADSRGELLSMATESERDLLDGADGVVFVADSQKDRLSENPQSLTELATNISRRGKRCLDDPLVLQYNTMDHPDALPVPALDRYLNTMGVPRFEAAATDGSGVLETLPAICKLVTSSL